MLKFDIRFCMQHISHTNFFLNYPFTQTLVEIKSQCFCERIIKKKRQYVRYPNYKTAQFFWRISFPIIQYHNSSLITSFTQGVLKLTKGLTQGELKLMFYISITFYNLNGIILFLNKVLKKNLIYSPYGTLCHVFCFHQRQHF